MFGLDLVMAGYVTLASTQVTCPPEALPQIRVIPSQSQVKYDNSKSKKQLETFDIDTVSPYDAHTKTHVGGLMSGEIGIETNVSFVQQSFKSEKQGCLYINAIDVKIVQNPTIYIAREFRRGTCDYNAILEHEHKHVTVDQMIVQKYSQRISRTLAYAFNKYGATYGPFPLSRKDEMQDKIYTYIEGIIQSEQDKMVKERGEKQQAVDTIEEYERVQALCD